LCFSTCIAIAFALLVCVAAANHHTEDIEVEKHKNHILQATEGFAKGVADVEILDDTGVCIYKSKQVGQFLIASLELLFKGKIIQAFGEAFEAFPVVLFAYFDCKHVSTDIKQMRNIPTIFSTFTTLFYQVGASTILHYNLLHKWGQYAAVALQQDQYFDFGEYLGGMFAVLFLENPLPHYINLAESPRELASMLASS